MYVVFSFAMKDVDEFVDKIKELSKPSYSLSSRDKVDILAIAYAGKELMTNYVKEFVHEAKLAGQPLLCTYMSDGWGVTMATL